MKLTQEHIFLPRKVLLCKRQHGRAFHSSSLNHSHRGLEPFGVSFAAGHPQDMPSHLRQTGAERLGAGPGMPLCPRGVGRRMVWPGSQSWASCMAMDTAALTIAALIALPQQWGQEWWHLKCEASLAGQANELVWPQTRQTCLFVLSLEVFV